MTDNSRIPTSFGCRECPATCCKNLAMGIGKPQNKNEVDDLRWQLHFDTVKVYVRNKRWYQLVEGKCMYLGDDNRCQEYNGRPQICRRHNPPDCELYGRYYDTMISTPGELDDYLKGRG